MPFDRWWDVVRMRARSLVRRARVESDLSRELRFHVEQETQQNIELGMTPGEARTTALRRLGGVAQVEEECREMRRVQYIEQIGQDLRYAARSLARSPGFTSVIVLTLALSIGINSAIFSVIEGVVLKPLPYPAADRLTRIFYHSPRYAKFPVNHFDLRDIRSSNRSFESVAAYTHFDVQLAGVGEPVKLSAFRVTSGYFATLGLRPARGREFGERDEIPANGLSAILSDRLWRNQFGAAPDILGRKIMLDAQPYAIVGVMPPGTDHPGNAYNPVAYGQTVDLWTPFTFEGNPARRGSHYVEAIGRLKRGVSAPQAEAEVTALLAELGARYPQTKGWTALVVPLQREVVGSNERLLLVLSGAVGLVLLIACVNAANLLLARAMARQREIAVRTALGAGRARLMRQMLTESLLIAGIGGAAGAALGAGGMKALVAMLPAGFPRAASIRLDGGVFGFTLLIAVATGLVFGLAPALQAARFDVQQGLREGGRGSSAGGRHTRLRGLLVISEVALASVLLIGAGLLLRSLVNLLRADPGFHAAHVLTATLSLPLESYRDEKAMEGFYGRLLADAQTIPGVEAAGVGTDLPWTGYDDNLGGWVIEGRPSTPSDSPHGRYHLASAEYFRALGIPLLGGRFFRESDNAGASKVLIVNQAMARLYWPGENAVGKRIDFGYTEKEPTWTTIVGVVADVKDRPNSANAEPAFWWPVLQMPWSNGKMSVVLRGAGDPGAIAGELRRAVRRLDGGLAVADVRRMDEVAGGAFSTPRFALFLVALFAALALALAAGGIYGVVSYAVSRRMPEFGMRMALGARRSDVVGLVLREGLRLAAIGAAAGLAGGAILSRFLGTLLYEVNRADPATFAAVGALAVAVAAAACYIPARRATAADPMRALRAE